MVEEMTQTQVRIMGNQFEIKIDDYNITDPQIHTYNLKVKIESLGFGIHEKDQVPVATAKVLPIGDLPEFIDHEFFIEPIPISELIPIETYFHV